MEATMTITVRPNWLSALPLRALARPFIFVDGTEHPVTWGVPWKTSMEACRHVVSAGIRYRGSNKLLGSSPSSYTMREGQEIFLVARNGLLNHSPFGITEVPSK